MYCSRSGDSWSEREREGIWVILETYLYKWGGVYKYANVQGMTIIWDRNRLDHSAIGRFCTSQSCNFCYFFDCLIQSTGRHQTIPLELFDPFFFIPFSCLIMMTTYFVIQLAKPNDALFVFWLANSRTSSSQIQRKKKKALLFALTVLFVSGQCLISYNYCAANKRRQNILSRSSHYYNARNFYSENILDCKVLFYSCGFIVFSNLLYCKNGLEVVMEMSW